VSDQAEPRSVSFGNGRAHQLQEQEGSRLSEPKFGGPEEADSQCMIESRVLDYDGQGNFTTKVKKKRATPGYKIDALRQAAVSSIMSSQSAQRDTQRAESRQQASPAGDRDSM